MIQFMTQAGRVKKLDWQHVVEHGHDYDIIERYPVIGNYSKEDWRRIVGYYYNIDEQEYIDDYLWVSDPLAAITYIDKITKPDWA